MKVQNITDIEGFFKVIDECKGKVELVTGEGDRLNLKSKLSQYVSMANIFSNGEIPELEIIAYEKEDTDRWMESKSELTDRKASFSERMWRGQFPERGTASFILRSGWSQDHSAATPSAYG